jgi:hypothetical protein
VQGTIAGRRLGRQVWEQHRQQVFDAGAHRKLDGGHCVLDLCVPRFLFVLAKIFFRQQIILCGLAPAHLNSRATTFGHALTTGVAFAIVEEDLAAERRLRVLDVADGSPWTGRDGLADIPLGWTFPLVDNWFHFVSRLLKALEILPVMASQSPALR